jgi:hypothetical protein
MMILPLRELPTGIKLMVAKAGITQRLILKDECPKSPEVPLAELHKVLCLCWEHLDKLVHPFAKMVLVNVQSGLKDQANDDTMMDDMIMSLAIQQIDAMSGWGDNIMCFHILLAKTENRFGEVWHTNLLSWPPKKRRLKVTLDWKYWITQLARKIWTMPRSRTWRIKSETLKIIEAAWDMWAKVHKQGKLKT